jgi:hypothetical protein
MTRLEFTDNHSPSLFQKETEHPPRWDPGVLSVRTKALIDDKSILI